MSTARRYSAFDIILITWNFRENAGTSIAGNNADDPLAVGGDVSDGETKGKGKAGFSAFAAIGLQDEAPEEEEDFGGLMVRCMRYFFDSHVY